MASPLFNKLVPCLVPKFGHKFPKLFGFKFPQEVEGAEVAPPPC